jgi:hypothetical protein
MVDYSYPTLYSNYVKFCNRVDVAPLSFEDWMVKRDAPPHNKFEDTLKFLEETENSTPPVGDLADNEEVEVTK